jgi:sulfite exporter TauE/SafE
MIALIGTVFVASLLGSLHCAGMCGGFVSFYAAADPSTGFRRGLSHVAYNGGRLVTYVILGAVFGSLGQAADLAGSMAGVGRIAFVGAAVLMILWGVWALLLALNVRVPKLPVPAFVLRGSERMFQGLRNKPPLIRAGLLGLSSTFLPCGWLYAYAVMAAGTGTPLKGMAVMAVFWAGTVPILAGIGTGVQVLAGGFRKRLPVVTAIALILVGVVVLAGGVDRLDADTGAEQCHPAETASPAEG